jgi:hypothetical protein
MLSIADYRVIMPANRRYLTWFQLQTMRIKMIYLACRRSIVKPS